MARLVLGYPRNAEFIMWAEAVLDCRFDAGARTIGLEGDEGVRAVAVFERFTEGDCHIHIATTNTGHAMSRQFIHAAFIYPFVQLRQRRLTGLVQASNTRALRFNLKLGFVEEGRLRETHPNDDTIVMGMLRRECRFIPAQHR